MFLRRLVTLVAVAAALAVFSLLVWKSQQQPLDAVQLGQQLAELEQVKRNAQLLEPEILRLRIQRDTDFHNLDTLQADWLASIGQLSSGNFSGAVQLAGASPLLRAYRSGAEQGVQILAQLRERQLDFVASFEYFRSYAERELTRLVTEGQDEQLRANVVTLVDALAVYSLQSRPDNIETLETLLLVLEPDLPQLAASARQLKADKDALQQQADSLAALPLRTTLARLDERMRSALQQQEQASQRYTLALAAFAGALLLVFGLIGLRLQSSYGALDKVNANLEKLVEERTGELNRALNELRAQQAHLIQSEKLASLGQMVAGVAHEINTPLGYANSNVETIKESLALVHKAGGLSEDADERLIEADVLLEDAMHGLAQIDELVKSLKNFSRVDRSATELFDLNEGLDTSLKICQTSLKGRITIEKDYQSDLPKVHCAPSQINQVFLNLINNGAQAIEGEGVIRLSTRQVDDQVEIRVADTGCGMDAETQAHIFEPFFTTKPVGEGTGLGMSIVFRIIEDHGGRITLNSAPGEGAEFVIQLPLKVAVSEAQAPQAETAQAANWG